MSRLSGRVEAHYRALGWTVLDPSSLPSLPPGFFPDLVLGKGQRVLAVRIDEEHLGSYAIGVFGAQCRRAKLKGLIVCESSPEVLEACDAAGLDFADAAMMGEPVVLRASPPPAVVAMTPIAAAPAAQPEPPIAARSGSRWWRWLVVALIWAAALTVSGYWLTLVT